MTSRMTIRNSRLLFAPSHFHKLEVRYQSRIAELDHAIKSADSYTSARNAFLKMMVAHLEASCGSEYKEVCVRKKPISARGARLTL